MFDIFLRFFVLSILGDVEMTNADKIRSMNDEELAKTDGIFYTECFCFSSSIRRV